MPKRRVNKKTTRCSLKEIKSEITKDALKIGITVIFDPFVPEDLDHVKEIVGRIKKVRGVRTVMLNYPAA